MSATRPDRAHILDLMRALLKERGRAPGARAFETRTRVSSAHVKYYWPTHSALVTEAGGVSNRYGSLIPEDELFREYAQVCVHLGHRPSFSELRIATRTLGTRTHTVQTRWGTLAEFERRFRQWATSASDAPGGILGQPGWDRERRERLATPAPSEVERALHPFLPSILMDMPALARNENSATDEPASQLFERRCADAFRCLGFEVSALGQGKGRVADCVAVARAERFAVVIDAKARGMGFALGTEDRKFIEYAKSHSAELKAQGIERIYLSVVATSFRPTDVPTLRDALTDGPIRAFCLLPVAALLAQVETSILERHRFTLRALERVFFSNGIVAP